MSSRNNGMNGYRHFCDRDRKAAVVERREQSRQETEEIMARLEEGSTTFGLMMAVNPKQGVKAYIDFAINGR